MSTQIHATCVVLDGAGVLICGPSGSGKSDLALRLIDGGACLVADDRVDMVDDGGVLVASAPANLAGMIEVRGLGIICMAHDRAAPVRCVIDLTDHDDIERLPPPRSMEICGLPVSVFHFDGRDASATAKVRLAVALATGRIMRADD